jgi:hypothetical protein
MFDVLILINYGIYIYIYIYIHTHIVDVVSNVQVELKNLLTGHRFLAFHQT